MRRGPLAERPLTTASRPAIAEAVLKETHISSSHPCRRRRDGWRTAGSPRLITAPRPLAAEGTPPFAPPMIVAGHLSAPLAATPPPTLLTPAVCCSEPPLAAKGTPPFAPPTLVVGCLSAPLAAAPPPTLASPAMYCSEPPLAPDIEERLVQIEAVDERAAREGRRHLRRAHTLHERIGMEVSLMPMISTLHDEHDAGRRMQNSRPRCDDGTVVIVVVSVVAVVAAALDASTAAAAGRGL